MCENAIKFYLIFFFFTSKGIDFSMLDFATFPLEHCAMMSLADLFKLALTVLPKICMCSSYNKDIIPWSHFHAF